MKPVKTQHEQLEI
jgi:hypothetical protein